jgi:glycosyltransferase involved in cell wall biosynthesis
MNETKRPEQISVVIPSYNSGGTVARTLDGLLRQPGALVKEIIIVDSSDDGETARVLAGYAGRVKVMRREKKTIPALGRNIGAAEASAGTLAFIDADAFPAPDWAEKILKARAEGVRVGGGSISVPDFQKWSVLSLAQCYLEFNEFMDIGTRREKQFVASCNLFCETSLFRQTGGFPDIRASEDVLFGLKVGEIAKPVFYPDIRVYHIFRHKLSSYLKNQMLLGRFILVYRRMRGAKFLSPWVVVPLSPVFFLIKFARIFARVVQSGPKHVFFFLYSLPLLLLGVGYWTAGFVSGSFTRPSGE